MKERERFDPLALVLQIANQENSLKGTTFIAPCVGGAKVRLRLDGIIYEMQARNCPEGWAILEIVEAGLARFVQRAPLSMVKNYLGFFPRVRLLMVDNFEKQWWALPASVAGQKIQITGVVPIHLSQSSASFDTVYSRFDGASFWFEAIDRRRDPLIARKMREALACDLDPEELRIPGMVPQERLAYKMLYLEKHGSAAPLGQPDDGTRIRSALEHAGARLESFWSVNCGDTFSVRFRVDGNLHVVQVQPRDLTVISAGICLSGEERNFDLSSLVGVLREAHRDHYLD